MHIPSGVYIIDNNGDRIEEHTANGINAVVVVPNNLINFASFLITMLARKYIQVTATNIPA